MERYATAFQREDVPLRRKLLEFLPGLVAKPGATEKLLSLGGKGLPHREIFFRALSALSERPSLITAGRCEPLRNDLGGASAEGDVVSLPCASPHFLQGWNKVERSPTKTFRWMEQVGILLNPRPGQRLKRLDVEAEEWYGNLDRTITAVAGGTILGCERHEAEGGSATLVFTSPDGMPFTAPHIALVAGASACPWHYNGAPDMRLLSCQVTSARLHYEGSAA